MRVRRASAAQSGQGVPDSPSLRRAGCDARQRRQAVVPGPAEVLKFVHRIQPESISEIVATVRSHLEARRPLAIEGSGAKSGLGRPVEAEALLSLRGLSGIRVYQPDELVLTAWSGTPMREIWEALAEKRQCLAFEPAVGALY